MNDQSFQKHRYKTLICHHCGDYINALHGPAKAAGVSIWSLGLTTVTDRSEDSVTGHAPGGISTPCPSGKSALHTCAFVPRAIPPEQSVSTNVGSGAAMDGGGGVVNGGGAGVSTK